MNRIALLASLALITGLLSISFAALATVALCNNDTLADY